MNIMNEIKKGIRNFCYPSFDLNLSEWLKEEPIYIADVGSTGGPERRWTPYLSHCVFYSFDPDPRAVLPSLNRNFVFPIGLWSSKEVRELNLSKFQAASSLYEFTPFLESFLNAPCHEIERKVSIQLDRMENVLKDHPSPDFLKIDAEGADLEILKGADSLLRSSCLGVQIEVSHNERHQNAPLFSSVDAFLRERGYHLFDISNERWIRKNSLFGSGSRAQLIWGNAVYFLSKEEFLKRLSVTSEEQRLRFIHKFFLLTTAYHFYDFAFEIVQECEKRGMLKNANFYAEQLKCRLKSQKTYGFRVFLALLFGFLSYPCFYIVPSARRKIAHFIKDRLRQFSQILLNLSRSGPYSAVITEESDL